MMTKLARGLRLWLGLLLVLVLALPVLAQQATSIAVGPYVQNVSKDSATICWATSAGQVAYAPAGGEKQTAGAYSYHSVHLQELEPGTTYTYDLLGDGSDAGKGTFTTFPADEQAFTFAVYGDTQGHREDLKRRLVARIIAEGPDLVFHVGDLVNEGWDIREWETFFHTHADLMRNLPLYPALGNHELDCRYCFDFFSLPGNERYYSFDRGAAHFVVLDSPGPLLWDLIVAPTERERARIVQERKRFWEEQLAWLKDDLAGHREAKYVFVFSHYPLYSMHTGQGYLSGAQMMRKTFGTIFQDYNVSAVFNGHDHQYHRAVAGGVPFVVAGYAGGNPRDPGERLPETVKFAQAITLVRVDVGPERAMVRVNDIDGALVDEFEIPTRGGSSAD